MARSMTGFGKASTEYAGEVVSIEATSVNHRFLDCTMRLPGAWSALEGTLRELVKRRLARGKVNLFFNRKRGATTRQVVCFDAGVARQYVEASRELSAIMETTQAISLDVLAQMEGVFYQQEREDDLDEVQAMLESLLENALEQLNAMRAEEGRRLAEEMLGQLAMMRETLAGVEERLPALGEAYAERLRSRLRELNADAGVTEDRLALELAIMADKADVTEEVVRLKAHFDQVAGHLASDDSSGRELNFIAQEIQREVNTLGSKLRDADVSRDVVRMKAELEKLREQAQNIE